METARFDACRIIRNRADARAGSARSLSDRRLHGGRVRESQDLSHPHRRPGRAAHVSRRRSGPRSRADVARICDCDGRLRRCLPAWPVRPGAAASLSAAQSSRLSRRAAGPRLQHCGQLHHQYQLAGLRRRDDPQPSVANARPDDQQLPRFGGGDRDGGRADACARAKRIADHRQLLGRYEPAQRSTCSCRCRSSSRSPSQRSAFRKRSAPRSKRPRSKAQSRSSPWGRSPARRPSN